MKIRISLNSFYIFISFIIISGSIIYTFQDEESDGLSKYFLSIIYLISLIYSIVKVCALRRIVKSNFIIVCFFLYMICTAFWSVDKLFTISKLIPLIGSFFFASFLVISSSSTKEFEKVYLNYFNLVVPLSFLFVFILPNYAIGTGNFEGDWLGVYTHKNILGKHVALGIIVFWSFLKRKSLSSSTLYLPIFFMLLVLLIMSNSATSIFSIAMAYLIFFLIKTGRRIIPLSLILIVTIAIILIANYEFIFSILGRDVTFSGRLFLWFRLFAIDIPLKPLLGYGYSAFWNDISMEFVSLVGWAPQHAHNGYIQMTVAGGFFALLFVLIIFFQTVSRSIFLLKKNDELGGLGFVYSTFFAIYNLTEVGFAQENNFIWISFIAIAFQVNLKFNEIKSSI